MAKMINLFLFAPKGKEGANMIDEHSQIDVKDSILDSVKKYLGYPVELAEFDSDIILNINAAILTLMQLGIGPTDPPFFISDNSSTYEDYLGDRIDLIGLVKMYLVYKTTLGFDSISKSGTYVEMLKEQIRELEWRLNIEVEEHKTFKEPIAEEVESNA